MEGRVPWMYPDSEGNVTIGVGHLIPNAESGTGLPLMARKAKRAATPDEIRAAWTYVRTNRQPYRDVYLEEPAIDKLLEQDCARCQYPLRRAFGTALDLPRPAVIALWDMAFNLGSFGAFPRLRMAIAIGDFEMASQECVRRSIGKIRNDMTREMLLDAGLMAAAKLPDKPQRA